MNNSGQNSIIAIIQARMGSSRLPGKVLTDIGGKPMLARVVLRARRASVLDQVIIATTTEPSDDPIEAYCLSAGFPCFRGDPYDVLDRYYQAAKRYQADPIVRITADCPLIDPGEIDRTVWAFFAQNVDFAANRLPPPLRRTTPIGMDTEVVRFAALARAWREADAKYAREHVMPYLYEEPGRFKTLLINHEPDLGYLRLTVDTPLDLALVREIYAAFGDRDDFTLVDILRLLDEKPHLIAINAGVNHKGYQEVDQSAL
jgi:spore coat polysaccharide biosynthesis protein SpsF